MILFIITSSGIIFVFTSCFISLLPFVFYLLVITFTLSPYHPAELELCPATFADKDDSAELVRAIEEVGGGHQGLGAKGAPGRCYVTTATAAARVS